MNDQQTLTEAEAVAEPPVYPETVKAENTKVLIDVEAVSTIIDCSERHVYRLADEGKMPKPLKLGALVRWRRTEIDAWIDGGCRPVRSIAATGARRK